MKPVATLAIGICTVAVFSLTGCSDAREEAVGDSVITQAEAPPEVDVITNDPDGELGVATSGEPPAGKPSVVNPPDDIATGAEEAPGQLFSELDENADGYVQPDEAEGNEELSQIWQQLDENGDQQLDAAEFAKFEAE